MAMLVITRWYINQRVKSGNRHALHHDSHITDDVTHGEISPKKHHSGARNILYTHIGIVVVGGKITITTLIHHYINTT